METSKLKKFAQYARRSLIDQVSSKLVLVLAEDSAARRESTSAVRKLEEQISEHGKEQVIEKIAYIWFNRFCALRFMDVNRYTRIGVVSPAGGQFQPEILAEAKMGHIDEDTVPEKIRQQIFALLGGTVPSRDPQSEAYRLLVVAACNDYHKAMPYLFERIADYTELLMPDDLLSGNSILAYTREAMTPDVCQDVEVIGWLYQFYISEKKDAVFDGLKRNKKIIPENIPAATQLFTPHWIVRYLVENSLGRLWMLNRPNSRLVAQMDYYITPEKEINHEKHERHEKENQENFRDFRAFRGSEEFLVVNSPEEIKICDPACGSGHMLVYAFDLLYAIYEEEGVNPADIPEKILTYNLYGIEIDERAGELAAFALTMKARAKQRRFFSKQIAPNICVLENIHIDETEINEYMDFVGQDIFTLGLKTTLSQFEEADNFGSLIRPDVTNVKSMLKILEAKNVSEHLFLSLTHQKVLQVLKQADYLSPKYHVVIANPPYMGGKGMNGRLAKWAKDNYPNSKTDLFSMFMVRSLELVNKDCYMGMINLPSWLFLSSFEKLRSCLINNFTIESLLHMGRGIFGIDWGATAFVLKKSYEPMKLGSFFRLHKRNFQHIYFDDIAKLFLNAKRDTSYKYDFDAYRDENGVSQIESISNEAGQLIFYQASAADFKKITGSPIAYWVGKAVTDAFANFHSLSSCGHACSGVQTGDNDLYLRQWYEVSLGKIGYNFSSLEEAQKSQYRWFPHKKGGALRRWYGNCDFVIDWDNSGYSIKNNPSARPQNMEYWFKEAVTWSHTSSGVFSARYSEIGYSFNVEGPSYFTEDTLAALGFFCSAPALYFMQIMNPTLHFLVGSVSQLPYAQLDPNTRAAIREVVEQAITLTLKDWNCYETSWDFGSQPFLHGDYKQSTLKATYQKLRIQWREMTLQMQGLEEQNNRSFIDAYNLQHELKPLVPLNEITLTCNAHFRYGDDKNDEELDALLLVDTMRELISYAVGCMFGRYSLDKPGLILANQGETIDDYLKQIPEPSFPADDDNVIPMLDGDWFTDDITERFCKFLKVTFGEEHYEENLTFIEKALGKDIRKYFLKDFYIDHWKRYKKRPIYWLFSSPKGSFNALIYMHRYRPDTVSVVLNDYLREFRTKLSARRNHLDAVSINANASQGEKTKALKEIESLRKMIDELDIYEREVLYPLATEQMEIDLDDGVKVNYQKFGEALKKIPGLAAKDEE
ncbi:MAG: BREX-1 system adenine-specific DNA-methyltransferase PglX [Methylococcaceae bacterium]